METVCRGKQWDVALAYSKDGSVIGALPYLLGSKFGLRYIVQPQLTQYNGPWYHYPERLNMRKKLQFQYDVDKQLISHLKGLRLAFFSQSFAPEATNWLPYHWDGYRQSTRYSYRYEDLSDTAKLLDGMSPKDRRGKIVSLMPNLNVVTTVTPDRFAAMVDDYWEGQGKKCLLQRDFVQSVCESALQHGHGLIVGLEDKETGLMKGAAFAIYDSRCAYSLMSAFDRNYGTAGISECLFWALIQTLSSRTKAFDFEGSMDREIEYYYRSFGATPIAYHHIWKINNPLLKPYLERRGI